MKSNVPPPSNWLCEIMGLGMSSPLIVSEFMYGFDGAPYEMILRSVAFDSGNWISASSKNGLKVSKLEVKPEQNVHTYVPTTYNPDTGLTG
jgi:hypothetical protein